MAVVWNPSMQEPKNQISFGFVEMGINVKLTKTHAEFVTKIVFKRVFKRPPFLIVASSQGSHFPDHG